MAAQAMANVVAPIATRLLKWTGCSAAAAHR